MKTITGGICAAKGYKPQEYTAEYAKINQKRIFP